MAIVLPDIRIISDNMAIVDGVLLARGLNWSNGSLDVIFEDGSVKAGPSVKISMNYSHIKIHVRTLGVVKPRDSSVLINPKLANSMACSDEIRYFLKQAPFALAQLRGDAPNRNGVYGLSTSLYGVDIFVDDDISFPKYDFYLGKRSALMVPTCLVDGSCDRYQEGSGFYLKNCI